MRVNVLQFGFNAAIKPFYLKMNLKNHLLSTGYVVFTSL